MRDKSIKTADKLDEARRLYLLHPKGITDAQLSTKLGVSRRTANRYRLTLNAVETYQNSYLYTLIPTEEEIEFALVLLRRAGYTTVEHITMPDRFSVAPLDVEREDVERGEYLVPKFSEIPTFVPSEEYDYDD